MDRNVSFSVLFLVNFFSFFHVKSVDIGIDISDISPVFNWYWMETTFYSIAFYKSTTSRL